MKHFDRRVVAAAVLSSMFQTGQAACPLDGATPMLIGPHNPQTTFPLWVQDGQGLALEICPGTDQVNCISVPPFTVADFPGDPLAAEKAALSQQIGSGDEGFWGSADAIIDMPNGGGDRALLVSAVEAAFLPDFADGNQFAFTRLRLRVDIAQAGTYVVTHPWGQIQYDGLAPGPNAINDSFDLPFLADEVGYQGRLGPILTWDTFPGDPALDLYGPPFQFTPPFGTGAPDGIPDYIGTLNFVNPVTGGPEHAVQGSPCGTNFFRIAGFTDATLSTPLNFDPADSDGNGSTSSVETDLFTVTGKVYNGPALPTPLSVDQATYSRDTLGRVNVFATAPFLADVSFAGGANLPAGPQAMSGDGSGRFFGSVALTPDMTTVPGSVDVTAQFGGIAPALSPNTQNVPLVDLVTITRAEFDYATKTLTIEAHSSDLTGSPTLSALGQNLTGGVLTVPPPAPPGEAVAPASVTVTSTAGGSATFPVTVIHP